MQMNLTKPMHIHSLGGELREATIVEKVGDNKYIADYNGVKCSAIFNLFVGEFYVDDKYGIIQVRHNPRPRAKKAGTVPIKYEKRDLPCGRFLFRKRGEVTWAAETGLLIISLMRLIHGTKNWLKYGYC